MIQENEQYNRKLHHQYQEIVPKSISKRNYLNQRKRKIVETKYSILDIYMILFMLVYYQSTSHFIYYNLLIIKIQYAP